MDIQLKPKPWYVKYRYLIAFVIIFLSFTVYVIILASGPRQLKIDSDDYKTGEANIEPFMEYVDV